MFQFEKHTGHVCKAWFQPLFDWIIFLKTQKTAKKCFIFVSVPCFRSLFFFGLGVQLERFFFIYSRPEKKVFPPHSLSPRSRLYTRICMLGSVFFFRLLCILHWNRLKSANSSELLVRSRCLLAVFFFPIAYFICHAEVAGDVAGFFFCWVQSWSLNVNLKLLK